MTSGAARFSPWWGWTPAELPTSLTWEREARAPGGDHGKPGGGRTEPRLLHLGPDTRALGRVPLGRGLSGAREDRRTTGKLTFIHEVSHVEEEPVAVLVAGAQGERCGDLALQVGQGGLLLHHVRYGEEPGCLPPRAAEAGRGQVSDSTAAQPLPGPAALHLPSSPRGDRPAAQAPTQSAAQHGDP